jgi:hypothetical protein
MRMPLATLRGVGFVVPLRVAVGLCVNDDLGHIRHAVPDCLLHGMGCRVGGF